MKDEKTNCEHIRSSVQVLIDIRSQHQYDLIVLRVV